MIDYVLQITLQSPLTSAAGEGRVGLVDRDIAFDNLGLPILPGRRIKGLWREAYSDVVDAGTLCGSKLICPERIFGKVGQNPDKDDVCIHVGNAELHKPKASFVKEWLKYFQHPGVESNLHPDDVMQHFTAVRAQTSIDRQTGTALENTYRLTRNLKTGLVFWAPVRFLEPPDAEILTALVLGAAALQHMGTARTRGLGKVRCQFICGLTDKVLSSSTFPAVTVDNTVDHETESANVTDQEDVPEQLSQTSEYPATDNQDSNCDTPTHILCYRLTLRESAVIPMSDGDPNTVMTRQEVPGSNVLGAAAWKYLRQPGNSAENDEFRHFFLDGGVRFLMAYPEAIDGEPQRTIPISHSIRKFKEGANRPEEEKLVDFLELLDDSELLDNQKKEKKAPKKRLDRHYALIWKENLSTQLVKMERNYHHARAGLQAGGRSIGRALGNQVEGGAFFQYEAIQADQIFQGAVLGSMRDLAKLQTWMPNGGLISVGRSRSAQYGQTEFEWIDKTPQELNGRVEWDAFLKTDDAPVADDCLIITTLSALLSVNKQGHPDVLFPVCELANVLGLDACDLKLSHSYTRTEIIGGYHTHLRLPRQQVPAIAAGSVFVFSLKKQPEGDRLLKLEHKGLGIRKGEGYGRIAVNRQGALSLTNTTEKPLDYPKHKKPEFQIPTVVQDLLCGVARRHCLMEMQQRAITTANRTKNIPNNTVLGKLRLLLQQSTPVAIKTLNALRPRTIEKLERCQIDTNEPDTQWLQVVETQTLYGLFQSAWEDPQTFSQDVIEIGVNNLVPRTEADTRVGTITTLKDNESDTISNAFLDYFLTALYRRSRKDAMPTQ